LPTVDLPLLPGLPALSTALDGELFGIRLGDLLLGGNFKYFRPEISSLGLSITVGEQDAFKLLKNSSYKGVCSFFSSRACHKWKVIIHHRQETAVCR